MQVVGRNAFGCVDSAQTTVVVAPPIRLVVDPDTTLCDTNALVLNSQATNGQSYQWSDRPDLSNVLGQNSQLVANVGAGRTVYYVQVADTLGCTALDSIEVAYQPVDLELRVDVLGCLDSLLSITSINLTPNPLTYQWSTVEGNIVAGQGTAQIALNGLSQAWYQLRASNAAGCAWVDSVLIVPPALSQLGLEVRADQDTVVPGTTVQLYATNDPSYGYDWSSGANPPTIYNPTARLDQTSTFYVTVTDDRGCTLEDSVVVWVQADLCEDPYVFVPNAFSPDGDGYNDVIFVQGGYITHINFVIYNRWGEQVFQTTTVGAGWDGRYKGKDCAPDVYGYYMECRCLDGTRSVRKGNITLLR